MVGQSEVAIPKRTSALPTGRVAPRASSGAKNPVELSDETGESVGVSSDSAAITS